MRFLVSINEKVDHFVWFTIAATCCMMVMISSTVPFLGNTTVLESFSTTEDETYRLLLVISVLVTIPLAVNQLLDVKEFFSESSIEKLQWIYKTSMVCSLALPSLIQFFLNGTEYYRECKFVVLYSQKLLVIVSSFGSMRRDHKKQGKNVFYEAILDLLPLGSFFMFMASFIIFIVFVSWPELKFLFLVAMGGVGMSYFYSVLVLVLQLYVTRPKGFPFHFTTADDYRGFCNSMVTVFLMTALVIPTVLASGSITLISLSFHIYIYENPVFAY